MTKLTLEYLALLETIRNNKVIANLRDAELMELIRNNRRVFKINLDKNTIQKAYNDQLDKRERDKLDKQVSIDLKKLEETIRHNKASEINERYAATVNAYSRGKVSAAAIGTVVGIANQGINEYTSEPKVSKFDSASYTPITKSDSKIIDWRDYASVNPRQAKQAAKTLKESYNDSANKTILKGGKDNVTSYSNQSPTQISGITADSTGRSGEGSARNSVYQSRSRSSSNIIVSPSARTSAGRSFGPGIS